MYHYWDKGCSISGYAADRVWIRRCGEDTIVVVMNPGDDYDGRNLEGQTT